MAKFNFHLKSFSSSSTATAAGIPQTAPDSSKKPQRSPKEYFVSLRDRRLFGLRRSQSQKELKARRNSSPISFPGKLKRNVSPLRTPQFTSLFSPRLPARSENSRHHRQYAVSLSHLPQMRATAMLDEPGISLDPESPSEMTRIRRLNPRKSKSPIIPPVIITVPSRDELGLQGVREPLLKRDIVTQFMPIPPLDLRTPPSYTSRSREHSSSSSSRKSPLLASTGKEVLGCEEALPRQNRMSGIHRVAEILQEAAQSLDDDPAFSRVTVFHYLAPLVVFICVLGLAVLIPRNYSFIKDSFGIDARVSVSIIVLGAIGCALVLLEGFLQVIGILCQSFCEMDLETMFRTSEIVDTNGGRIGDVNMIVGMFG